MNKINPSSFEPVLSSDNNSLGVKSRIVSRFSVPGRHPWRTLAVTVILIAALALAPLWLICRSESMCLKMVEAVNQKKLEYHKLHAKRLLQQAMIFPEPHHGNLRGLTAKQVLEEVGLVDAVMRSSSGENSLPPSAVFAMAEREITIAAVSASRTMDKHREILRAAMDRGVKLNLLIVDPTDRIRSEFGRRDSAPLADEILAVGAIATSEHLWEHPRFELRARDYIPPFTGVLIDGDIAGSDDASDSVGFLRIQPLMQHHNPRLGPVLQFAPIPGERNSAFHLFREDLRKQWSEARRVNSEGNLVP